MPALVGLPPSQSGAFTSSRRQYIGYAGAVASVIAATLFRLWLHPLLANNQPFAAYVIVVIFTAWYAGFGPSLLASFLGACGGYYFFLPPLFVHGEFNSAPAMSLVFYFIVTLSITIFSEARLTAKRSAEALAAEVEEDRRKLEEANTRTNEVLTSISDGFVVLDREWRYVYMNAQSARMLHREASEFIGKISWEVYPESVGSPFYEKCHMALATQTIQRLESYYAPLDLWLDISIYPSNNGVSIYTRDITERKRAQQAEQQLRLVMDAAPIFIAYIDTQEVYRFVNSSYAERFGLSREEIIGKSVQAVVGKEAYGILSPCLQRALSGEMANFDAEIPYKNIGVRSERISCAPDFGPDNVLRGILNLTTDLTEKVRTEEALRESEVRFRTIYENSRDAIGVVSNNRHVYVNPSYLAMFGYEKEEELIGVPIFDLVAPSMREAVLQRATRRAQGAPEPTEYEVRAVRKDATELDAEVRVTVYELHGERYTLNIVRDITERKQAEQALRESEARFRRLFDANIIGVIFWDLDGRILDANDAFLSMVGYTRDELKANKIHWKEMTPFEWTLFDEGVVEELMTARFTSPYQKEYFHKNGRRVPILIGNALLESSQDHGFSYVLDLTEQKQAEMALLESERRYRTLIDNFPNGAVVLFDYNLRYLIAGGQVFSDNGIDPASIEGKTLWEIWDPEIAEVLVPILRAALAGEHVTDEMSHGSQRYTLNALPVRDADGNVSAGMLVTQDITDHKRLEDQLFQSQKMESIGRLAGGIAHDFNNLLTAVLGYSELAIGMIMPDDPLHSHLQNINKAAERAADLTAQLLAFARKQMIAPRVIHLNTLILETDKILRRLIGANIELVTIPTGDLGTVKADPGQLTQCLVNLVLNARDAMPEGGKILIETDNVKLDAEYVSQRPEIKPGDYIMMSVTDTGTGMTEEIKSHIFEPFYTTKTVGKGTGLGLASCYGAVRQMGGHIWVYSEPDHGSRFSIYLPRYDDPISPQEERETVMTAPRGTETILLAEDEALLREIATQSLRKQGYTVLEAGNGAEALRIAEERLDSIDLLLTDIVMPQMGGQELAERLKTLRPDLKIMYVSGYTDSFVFQTVGLDPGRTFLQKPFTPTTLACRVRELLDMPPVS